MQKNLYLFLLFICFYSMHSFAQVTLINGNAEGGFESGSTFAANGWTVVNNTNANRGWYVGTGQAGYNGTAAAFIGNNSTTVGTSGASRVVHFYRSVTLPAGASNIKLAFKYKQAIADETFDYLRVFLNGNTPVSGTQQTTGLLTTIDPANDGDYGTYTVVTTTIPGTFSGTTNNLIFSFRADGVAPHAYGAVDSVTLTYVQATCFVPGTPAITGITTTAASASWAAPSGGNPPAQYNWEVRTAGDAGSGSSGLVLSGNAAGLSASLTGLAPGTAYSFYVRTDCGSGSYSDWSSPATFNTTCLPLDLPYAQDFNSITPPALPVCFAAENVNNDNSTWSTFQGNGTTIPSNLIRYSYSSTNAANDWFYTDGLNLQAGVTYRLRFKYKASDGPTYIEKLEVKYGTARNAAGMAATAIFTNANIASALADPFAQASIQFTVPSSGVYYLGFHCYSAADQAYLYVDDIAVDAPTCLVPGNVTGSNFSSAGATISWTAAGGSGVTGYEVAVQTTNTVPTTAGTPVTGTSYTTGGLQEGTVYYVFVRTSCGGGSYSDWTSAYSFFVPCSNAAPIPYNEDFETMTTPAVPTCYTIIDNNSDANTWKTASTNTAGGNVSIQYEYNSDGTTGGDDWFFLPTFQLTAGTSYSIAFKARASTSFPEKLEVQYGTTPAIAGMTNTLYTNSNLTGTVGIVQAFTPTTSGQYFIGFHGFSSPDEYYLSVDSIKVDLTASMPVTLVSFRGEKAGRTNKLNWQTANEQNNAGFELQRSASGSSFSTIGQVASHAVNGNSTGILQYSFDDVQPLSGANYYRLKQTDKDGRYAYSATVLLKGDKVASVQLGSIYPNPVTSVLQFAVASPASRKVNFVVTDLSGRTVLSSPQQLSEGDNTIQLPVSKLTAGTYLLKAVCEAGCETATAKFVKF
jgi:hypothetical protein